MHIDRRGDEFHEREYTQRRTDLPGRRSWVLVEGRGMETERVNRTGE